ncbi:hypothetical protein H0X09_02050 [Candidatus Saccharibacteria bacterium]|nr:hypothetical protein [Candidatus Saccharibacteria bacterium]
MKKANRQTGDETTQYYYDIFSEQLLVGEDARNLHLEAGGHPSDIYNLIELLKSSEIDIPFVYRKKGPVRKEKLVMYGQWLYNLMPPPERKNQKRLNENILRRAGRLGIGYSVWQIENEFTNLTNYYMYTNLLDTKRNKALGQIDVEYVVNYIEMLGATLGRKPNRDDLHRQSKENVYNPHPETIENLVGSLRKAYELAGWPDIHSMDEDDYINWGADFIDANGGIDPSQSKIDFLSTKDMGPSATTTAKYFDGSLNNFKAKARERYELRRLERQERKTKYLAEIEEGLRDRTLPVEIVRDIRSTGELLNRYSKLIVALKSGTEFHQAKYLALEDNAEYFKWLQDNRELAPKYLEQIATQLGCYEFIWTQSVYLNKLRVGYWKQRPSERRLRDIINWGPLKELKKYPTIQEVRKSGQNEQNPPTKVMLIKNMRNKSVPPELFRNASSGDEMFRRWKQFIIVDKLLGKNHSLEVKIRLSIPPYKYTELISKIKKYEPDL